MAVVPNSNSTSNGDSFTGLLMSIGDTKENTRLFNGSVLCRDIVIAFNEGKDTSCHKEQRIVFM
jgi:hypothetical protein